MKPLVYFACCVCGILVLAGCQHPSAISPEPAQPATRQSMSHPPQALQKFDFVEPKMGTVFRIVLYAPNSHIAERAAAAAFARVDQISAALSDYDPKSEINQLSFATNDGPMKRPVSVSDDLWRVLARGYEAAELSDGAFDVTIGPFTRLWRRARDLHELPTPQRLTTARASVGYRFLQLDPIHRTVQLLAPKMRLDVGGIAKGYTSEQVMAVLRTFGINRAIVGAAGDLSIGDPPPGKASWRIGIEALDEPNNIAGYVDTRNTGISTSGDTYRVIEMDGKRYSHIIDPATGLGLTRGIGVTVISPSDFTSDWLATAVSILGPSKGLALVEKIPGAAARIITLENGRSTVVTSRRFPSLFGEPAPTFPRSTSREQ